MKVKRPQFTVYLTVYNLQAHEMAAALDPNCLQIQREVDRIAISLQVVKQA